MRHKTVLAMAFAIATAMPATAQVVAMDPSLMTGHAGIAAAHHANKQRSARPSPTDADRAAARVRARGHCAHKEAFKAELGESDPRVGQIYRMCAQLGY